MIGHFPVPHRDELLYSVCARLQNLLNPPSKRGFCEALFGSGSVAVVDNPSRLNHICQQLPVGHPVTPERLLQQNTLLPLFLPFLPTERAQRCQKAALDDGGKKLPFLTGIMASRLSQPTHLRLCPLCREEDVAQYREDYWHRSHQIEGVSFCYKHSGPLVDSPIRRRSQQNRHEFHTPATEWTEIETHACEENNRLAVDTHWLLNENNYHPGLSLLREAYIEALKERRLAHPSGRIYLGHLLEQFTEFHGEGFLSSLNCALDANESWLAQLVRKGRGRCAHPIQHLLLIHFLGHTAQNFFQIVSSPRSMPTVVVPSTKQPRGKTVDTGLLKTLWCDPKISLREISRRFDCDPMTIKRKAAQAGLKFPRKAVRCTRKKPAYTHQPKSQLRRHRRQWEKALRYGRPARQLLPSTYSYLYRFDREWLHAHRPPRPPAKTGKQRVNWPERDHLLAAKAENLLTRAGIPPTANTVLKELGIVGLLRRNGHKLPQTRQTIRHYANQKRLKNHSPFGPCSHSPIHNKTGISSGTTP